MPKPRLRSISACSSILLFGVTLGLSPDAAEAQQVGRLYAAVTDQNGESVLDLTADDFEMSMDGTALTLVSVELDAAVPKIALLIDNGDGIHQMGGASPLRTGLASFLEILDPAAEVALFTIGGQVRRREDFTNDREELTKTAGDIFTETVGTKLMDGLFETWDRRFEDDDEWPVFVLVAGDVADDSAYFTPEKYTNFVTELMMRQVTVHAAVLTAFTSGTILNTAANLTENTGGRLLTISSVTGFDDSLSEFGGLLNAHFEQVSSRYLILYEVPETVGEGQLSMQISRPGTSLALFLNRRYSEPGPAQ